MDGGVAAKERTWLGAYTHECLCQFYANAFKSHFRLKLYIAGVGEYEHDVRILISILTWAGNAEF